MAFLVWLDNLQIELVRWRKNGGTSENFDILYFEKAQFLVDSYAWLYNLAFYFFFGIYLLVCQKEPVEEVIKLCQILAPSSAPTGDNEKEKLT